MTRVRLERYGGGGGGEDGKKGVTSRYASYYASFSSRCLLLPLFPQCSKLSFTPIQNNRQNHSFVYFNLHGRTKYIETKDSKCSPKLMCSPFLRA
jgi:hypothetical protein